jgi:hypothetical protein
MYVEVKFHYFDHGTLLNQQGYIRKLLNQFQMTNSRPLNTPMEEGVKLQAYMGADLIDQELYQNIVGALLFLVKTCLVKTLL